jgi:hypothetical protein
MAVTDVTKKAGIYHTLYRINAAFSAIVEQYEALREMGVVSARFSRRYEGFTRELQAEFNQDFLLPLHGMELDDWARFGKVRQRWEKQLRDPDDAALEARKQRKEQRAAGRKSRSKAGRSLNNRRGALSIAVRRRQQARIGAQHTKG